MNHFMVTIIKREQPTTPCCCVSPAQQATDIRMISADVDHYTVWYNKMYCAAI
ncbi:hypothetical protein DAPPUDRAFT_242385 [Daphnia pulex]|uniref:Uncharacterized protein n=1 Tax=Daphnia pulex TaxID=6669 RepID=E9GGJ2_DAPPU|nr:hypothetical protein DAPPUDRAFT_242385 [Daphnia pulex]|eukprot:EFX81482.1 hypothetical protein DAPPUDRAFT_242385 [Daphnia pulex]